MIMLKMKGLAQFPSELTLSGIRNTCGLGQKELLLATPGSPVS